MVMNICPNTNLQSWKDLVTAVGSFEAYRDFIEQEGKIRTPEEVKAKLENPEIHYEQHQYGLNETSAEVPKDSPWYNTLFGNSLLNNPQFELDVDAMENTRAIEIATKLSEQLNVDFEMITDQEAASLTRDAKNPWMGERAFFIGGRVYFVAEALTTGTVLHEFSHPLVRSLSLENKSLFDKLFNRLRESDEGRTIIETVKKDYPEMDIDSDLFKEEALVQALTQAGLNKIDGVKTSTTLAQLIKDLLYGIKQLLRKVFGQQVAVSKLDVDTTLDQLAGMLTKGDKFKIDTELITDEDVAAYMRDQKQHIDDLQNVENGDLQAAINAGYTTMQKHLKMLKNESNYKALADLFTDSFDQGDLQQILKDVQKHQTVIGNTVDEFSQESEDLFQRNVGFVNFLFRLELMARKMEEHMRDLQKNFDSVDNMHKAHYYNQVVKDWSSFIDFVNERLNDPKNNIPHDSPLVSLTRSITSLTDRISSIADSMYAEGSKEVLYTELSAVNKQVKTRFDELIENLRKKNAPQKRIDKYHKQYYGLSEADYKKLKDYQKLEKSGGVLNAQQRKEYNALKQENFKGLEITKEKVDALLKGQAGDANFFNSYFEGYLYSADPIVGGLALYVKNKLNDVMAKVQGKHNDFMLDIQPELKKAGLTFKDGGELGREIMFLDTVGKVNEEGELEEKKVWSLLGRFKNFRYEKHKLEHAVRQTSEAYDLSGSDEDLQAKKDALAALNEFEKDYMHRPFTDAYYKVMELLEGDDIGKEAAYRRSNVLEKIKQLQATIETESDFVELSDQIDLAWEEYRSLFSLRYNDNRLKGSLGTPEDTFEKAVTDRLREFRDQYNELKTEWKPMGNAFNEALHRYEQELVDNGFTAGSEQYKTLRQAWIDRNTRQVPTEAYSDRIRQIYEEIRSITSKLPDSVQKQVAMDEVYEQLRDIVAPVRDKDRQIDGTALSDRAIAEVKRLEEKLIEVKENFRKLSGITPAQQERLNELKSLKQARELTQEEQDEMSAIYNELSSEYLSDLDMAALNGLFQQLQELQQKQPTDYYVTTVNNFLRDLNTNKMHEVIGAREVTRENADHLLQDEILDDLMNQSEEFARWFRDNHLEKEVYMSGSQTMEMTWDRLYIWNVNRPVNSEYLQKTEITDERGNVVDTVMGIPVLRFYAREWKPEVKTEQVIGQTVNNRGEWLPKTLEEGAKDDRFINEGYDNLRKNKPQYFTILEKITNHHLQNQEGLSKKNKLYLDAPRFRKEAAEILRTKKVVKEKASALTIYAKRVKDFFYGAKDDAESGFNATDDMNLTKMDLFDNDYTDVPMYGLYDIEWDDVSTDITQSMMRYMLQAERHKQLVEISPFTRAVQQVVNDPKNKPDETLRKAGLLNRMLLPFRKDKDRSIRAKAVNAFIEREFEGQRMAGATKDMKFLNNTANLLFKRASFSFFALNIPSALKNQFGPKFQGLIRSAAGEYMNGKTFAKGEAWSTRTMMEVSAQVYKRGPKSLNVQLTELFDPAQGRFEEKIGESLSRTIGQDTANLSWLYNFRRWTELQATFHLFGSMMYKETIKRELSDGTVKEIPYMEAWEVRNGKLQLKEGVDPEWGITYDENEDIKIGKEYKHFKNKIHQVINNFQGAYGQFDQPEAQRYLAFRMISYLRRYFTTMAIDRWGFGGRWYDTQPRLNPGLGEAHKGFYITFLGLLRDTVTSLGRNLPFMTKEEKRAGIKVMTEMMALSTITMMMSMLFGWDPDDEDKYEKLRQKSGALPFPMTTEDPEHPFNGWGFLENHALFLMMNIQAENEQFLPFPGYGLDEYTALMDLKSIAFGPTTDTYGTLISDGAKIIRGDDRAYYQRRVGPYNWQQEGGNKFWAHLGVTLGITGSSIDPTKAIKGFQSAIARGR